MQCVLESLPQRKCRTVILVIQFLDLRRSGVIIMHFIILQLVIVFSCYTLIFIKRYFVDESIHIDVAISRDFSFLPEMCFSFSLKRDGKQAALINYKRITVLDLRNKMQLIVRFLLLNGVINDWEGILFTCEQTY